MGFKLWTSDVISDHAANWFTTSALFTHKTIITLCTPQMFIEPIPQQHGCTSELQLGFHKKKS